MNGDQVKRMMAGAMYSNLEQHLFNVRVASTKMQLYRKALFSQKITQISASLSGRPARGLLGTWHTKLTHHSDQKFQPTHTLIV